MAEIEIGALNANSDEGFNWKNETGSPKNIFYTEDGGLRKTFSDKPSVASGSSLAVFSTTSSAFSRSFFDKFAYAIEIPQSSLRRVFFASDPAAVPAPSPAPAEPEKNFIFLTVIDDASGAPIENASVSAGGQTLLTDSKGQVDFNLYLANWRVDISKSGYPDDSFYANNSADIGITRRLKKTAAPAPAPAPAPSPAPQPQPQPSPAPSPTPAEPIDISIPDMIGLTGNAGLIGKLIGKLFPPTPNSASRDALFMLGSVNPVNTSATFVEFLFEEAMQTAGMAVYQATLAKDWFVARDALNRLRFVFLSAMEFRKGLGKFNVTSTEAVVANLDAVASQLETYEKIISANITETYQLPESFTALAREITDGDTVKFKIGKETLHVRLVGINTPEKTEPYYALAKKYLFSLIWGKYCTIKVDPAQQWDAFGRALGTIFYNGVNINLKMVERGFAFYYPYEPNKYTIEKEMQDAQLAAEAAKRNVWSAFYGGTAEYPTIPAQSSGKTGVKISSSPTYANISIDGKFTFKQTAETVELPAGRHTILLELGGYKDDERVIEIPEGVLIELHAKLEKEF